MRSYFVVLVAAFLVAPSAMAQNSNASGVPLEEGNRANGLNYQPTPQEVVPREKAAGILPPAAQQKGTDRTLEQMDKHLLREDGLSTKSVPDMSVKQQDR